MKTRVRKRGALAVLLALCLLVAACGDRRPRRPPLPAPARPPPRPPITAYPENPHIATLGPVDLHVLFADDYYTVKPVVAVANAFMQMYPNVKITLEGTEWSQIPARVRTEIAGGNVTIDLAHQHAFVMGAQGYAEPIDDLLCADRHEWPDAGRCGRYRLGRGPLRRAARHQLPVHHLSEGSITRRPAWRSRVPIGPIRRRARTLSS